MGLAMGVPRKQSLHRSGNRRAAQTSSARIRFTEGRKTSCSQGWPGKASNPTYVSQCFDIVTTCSISLILSATLVVRRQLVEIFFSHALFESLFLQPLTPGLSLR